ncbi:MAG: flagellar brake protein [Desulfovibrionaceae bacterium]
MDAVVGSKALLETYGVREQLRCTLVGWSVDEFVVLKAPLNPGIRSRVTDGSQLAVRYLHGGELVGFRAEYIDFIFRPLPLLFVSYPDRFERHGLRGSARVSYSCLATLSAKGATYRGLLLDISEGGCRFCFDAEVPEPKLAKGDELEGYFTLLGSAETFEFRGTVASTERLRIRRELGLRFDPRGTRLPEDLGAYLDEVGEMMARLKRS